MTNTTTVTQPARAQEISSRMLPIDTRVHVEYRIAALIRAAEAERAAADQRRVHRAEHAVHPLVDHTHAPNGVRRTLGRALIGVGAAIAGVPDGRFRRAA